MGAGYQAIKMKHDGFEKRGFILSRPHGTQDYVFIHFKTPVDLLQQGEVVHALPGACILFEPGAAHWFESAECDLVHDWLHFLPDDLRQFQRLQLPVNQLFYTSDGYRITQSVCQCEMELINKEENWQQAVSAGIELLFIRLARQTANLGAQMPRGCSGELKNRFQRLRFSLYHQAQEDWDIDRMSAELSLSRSRFTVLYGQFFGVSPKADLIRARIERAKYLLASVDETVDRVAQLSGYANPYHFIRQFKGATGMTPGEYRARLHDIGK